MVAAIISAMVNDPQFSKAIKAKIGTSVDTEDLEKQLSTLQAQLRRPWARKAGWSVRWTRWILTIPL